MPRITPCLWFDDRGRRGGQVLLRDLPQLEDHGRLAVQGGFAPPGRDGDDGAWELNGQEFAALNGGPVFKFSEAVSFQINCEDQAEVDHYWEKLSEGGDPRGPAVQFRLSRTSSACRRAGVPRGLAEMLKRGLCFRRREARDGRRSCG